NKRVKRYKAILPSERSRAGTSYVCPQERTLVSRRELKPLLVDHKTGLNSDGDGLTFAEVMKRLSASRSLVERYESSCDPLEGEPLLPNPGHGRLNGRRVKKLPLASIERILRVRSQARDGRVYLYGTWWLSEERTLGLLHKITHRVSKGTLQGWRTNRC